MAVKKNTFFIVYIFVWQLYEAICHQKKYKNMYIGTLT